MMNDVKSKIMLNFHIYFKITIPVWFFVSYDIYLLIY